MKKVLMTSISSKGQIVIPHAFRKTLGLDAGTPIAIFSDGSHLLLKRIELPNEEAFGKLLKQSRGLAKKSGLKRSEVKSVVKKVRNESRS